MLHQDCTISSALNQDHIVRELNNYAKIQIRGTGYVLIVTSGEVSEVAPSDIAELMTLGYIVEPLFPISESLFVTRESKVALASQAVADYLKDCNRLPRSYGSRALFEDDPYTEGWAMLSANQGAVLPCEVRTIDGVLYSQEVCIDDESRVFPPVVERTVPQVFVGRNDAVVAYRAFREMLSIAISANGGQL